MQPSSRPARVRLLATAFSACWRFAQSETNPAASSNGLHCQGGRSPSSAVLPRKMPQRARESKAPWTRRHRDRQGTHQGAQHRSARIQGMLESLRLAQPRAEEVRPVKGQPRPVSPQTMEMTLMMRMMIGCSDNIGAVGAIFSTGHSQDCSDAAKDATRHPANNSTDDPADRSKYLISGARSGVSTLAGTRRDTLSVCVGCCDRNSAHPNDKAQI